MDAMEGGLPEEMAGAAEYAAPHSSPVGEAAPPRRDHVPTPLGPR
jgi:hypothetical protein